MSLDDRLKVHLVQLVTRENQRVLEVVVLEVLEILADRICRPLIPTRAGEALLGRQQFDEAATEVIELVALRDVPVQRSRVELRQQVDATETAVDAVGNGDVDQTVLARQRHGRLGAIPG